MSTTNSQTTGQGYTDKPTDEVPNNYPPEGQTEDTTSEGGYGGHAFAPAAQRGLIDQSTEGMPLGNEIQDAYQGKDVEAAAQYDNHEQSKPLNPYGEGAADNCKEQKDRLASSYTDSRARKYEGGAAGTTGFDADTR